MVFGNIVPEDITGKFTPPYHATPVTAYHQAGVGAYKVPGRSMRGALGLYEVQSLSGLGEMSTASVLKYGAVGLVVGGLAYWWFKKR